MKPMAKVYTALIMLFLFAPIVILLVFSFNASKSLSVFSVGSLYWYRELFRDSETLGAVRNTQVLAVSAALTVAIAVAGVRMFTRVERNFMDTV